MKKPDYSRKQLKSQQGRNDSGGAIMSDAEHIFMFEISHFEESLTKMTIVEFIRIHSGNWEKLLDGHNVRYKKETTSEQ